LYLLFEFVDHTMHDHLKAHYPDGMPMHMSLRYARDITRALRALYNGTSEPPLLCFNADNVLMTPEGVPKICGLSICQWLLGGEPTIPSLCFQYSAPETLLEPDYLRNASKRDVFSFATVLQEILTGQLPYHQKQSSAEDDQAAVIALLRQHKKANEQNKYASCSDLLMAQRLKQRLANPDFVCGHLSALLEMCWRVEPTLRPSFNKVFDILDNLQPRLETFPFWTDDDKVEFLLAVADSLDCTHNEFTQTLEETRSFLFGVDWQNVLDDPLRELVCSWKVDCTTVYGLVSFVRMLIAQARSHMTPPAINSIFSSNGSSATPVQILHYFERRIPMLVNTTYRVLSKDHGADIIQEKICEIDSKYSGTSTL